MMFPRSTILATAISRKIHVVIDDFLMDGNRENSSCQRTCCMYIPIGSTCEHLSTHPDMLTVYLSLWLIYHPVVGLNFRFSSSRRSPSCPNRLRGGGGATSGRLERFQQHDAPLRYAWVQVSSSPAVYFYRSGRHESGWFYSDGVLPINKTQPISVDEAYRLRARAKELLAEAQALELQLEESKSSSSQRRETESDDLSNRLFTNRPLTGPAVARVLRDQRWSVDQAVTVLESLYERRRRAMAIRTATGPTFNIGDVANQAEYNETEANLTQLCVDCLIDAASILDAESSALTSKHRNSRWSGRATSTLRSRWRELRRNDEKMMERRQQIQGVISSDGNVNATVDEYMRVTLGLPATPADQSRSFNVSRVLERVDMVPLWVPSTLLPYMVAARATVQADDVKGIKEKVLVKTKFFCTSTESIPSAALFRGNIRIDPHGDDRNATAALFEDIQGRMDAEGISKRVQLFLLPDPEWRPGKDERELKPRPVLLALSRLVEPDDAMMQQSVVKTVFKRSSFVLAFLTTWAYAVGCFALNPKFFDAVMNLSNPASIMQIIPLMMGVLGIQAIHELAHVVAARRHGIKLGFPIPLPSFDLGLIGCITPLRSFPINRAALLDFALSGPVAAFLASACLMVIGAIQTVRAPEAALLAFPFVPASILRSTFLSGSILTVLAPKLVLLPLSQPVPISPLFLIGLAGTVASALNLLPIFRIDGGRACTAAMGTRFAAFASAATLLFLVSSPLSLSSAFYWGMLVVLFQRRPEIPVRDDVTEVNGIRMGTWLSALAAAIASLLPFPGGDGIIL